VICCREDLVRDHDFGLIDYLIADLRRFRELMGTETKGTSVWRLLRDLVSPRFAPVLLCRIAYWLHCHHLGPLSKIVSLFNFAVFGIEIAVRCSIGKGLFFPHTQGTVIGAASIGENAIIYHGVTLGAKDLDIGYTKTSRPVVGNGVLIGSGAKVLGGVTIGNDVCIGANSVVLDSLPDGVLAVGVPARVVGCGSFGTTTDYGCA
jgi:serine O-acetyltransferase